MSGNRNRFRSRNDGFSRRRPVQACVCGWYTEEGKVRQCGNPKCGSEILQSFDSKVEFLRYAELRLMEKSGRIHALKLHPRFPIMVMTQRATPAKGCTYVADFEYINRDGIRIIEDVKPRDERGQTDVFKLKRRLFESAYGIPITIIAR